MWWRKRITRRRNKHPLLRLVLVVALCAAALFALSVAPRADDEGGHWKYAIEPPTLPEPYLSMNKDQLSNAAESVNEEIVDMEGKLNKKRELFFLILQRQRELMLAETVEEPENGQ